MVVGRLMLARWNFMDIDVHGGTSECWMKNEVAEATFFSCFPQGCLRRIGFRRLAVAAQLQPSLKLRMEGE